MKITEKQRCIVQDLVYARRTYLDADAKLEKAGEAYINTFGQNSRRVFTLIDGSIVDVDVPDNEDCYPEVTIHESDTITDLSGEEE